MAAFEPLEPRTLLAGDSVGDTFDTATQLGVIRGPFTRTDQISPGGDMDCYRFTMTSTGAAADQVELSFNSAQTSFELRVFDANRQYLPTAGFGATKVSLAGRAAGDYFVLVVPYSINGQSTSGTYTINVQAESRLPLVTLGNVVPLTEGFGYGSTIAGLGAALDSTRPNTVPGAALRTPLGLAESGKFTLEGWLYPKPGVTAGVVWDYRPGYQLTRVNDTGLRMVVTRSGPDVPGAKFDVTVDKVLNADAWNHVAMTFDGDRLTLYVNGVNVAAVPDPVPAYHDVAFYDPVNLFFFSGSLTGAGALDELRVWKTGRTQAEVQQSMLTPLAGTEPGLVAYWTFDNPHPTDVYVELDSSASGNAFDLQPSLRIENAAPQIGYVEVKTDTAVNNPLGLWVAYNITGGTALNNVDYVASRFRRVSDSPASERDGIIIPDGQATGRIYFTARSDAIFEATETIQVALAPYSFAGAAGGSDYFSTPTASTLSITDSGAFRPGFAVTDSSGRPVVAGSPLYVDPKTKTATFQVRLTSEPEFSQVVLNIRGGTRASVTVGGGAASSLSTVFTRENWDRPQTFSLVGVTGDGAFTIEDARQGGQIYAATAFSVPFTLTPPLDARPEEGNPLDVAPLKPTVNLSTVRNVNEDEDQPARLGVLLNTAAPAGGLDVYYTLAVGGSATPGTDFEPLSGVVHIEAGLLRAEIPVFPIDDDLDEGQSESLTVALRSQTGYLLGTQSQTLVTIVDDDLARIVAVNPSVVDVSGSKALTRPGFVFDEGTARYSLGEDTKTPFGTVGTVEVPGWTYTGGLAASFSAGQFDADVLTFTLAATADASAKISVRLTPSTATGQPAIRTVASGGDGVNTVNLAELLNAGSGTGTRLRGGSLASPRLPVVTGDDTLEWSLGGLAAGTYQLVLAATSNLSGILANAGSSGVAYDYTVVSTSTPVAPYQLVTMKMVSAYSSTYAPLVTIETVPPAPPATEPNNTPLSAYSLGTVLDGTAVASQQVDNQADEDLFRFQLDSAAGRPDALLAFFAQNSGDATHDLTLEVLSTSGTVLRTAAAGSANEYLDLSPLADGEYLARVRGATSAVTATPYSLVFKRLRNPNEPESNETLERATYLGVAADGDRYNDFAVAPRDDRDHYRFTLHTPAGRPGSVSVLNAAAEGDVFVALVNLATGATLRNPLGGGNVKTMPLDDLPDGDYGLRIQGYNGRELNRYDLAFGTLAARAREVNPNQVAVRLDTKPTANVTLNLGSGDPTEGQIAPTTLVFTPDNWDRYQLVSVTPLDDAIADGDITYAVTATATSLDPHYQNHTLKIDVTNVDRGNFVAPGVVDTNDEPNAPLVTITSLPAGPQGEGQTLDGFRIELSQPLTTNLTIGLDFDRGTAQFAPAGVATAGAVLGGDPGEGLDLDGNILYAVNARGPGGLRIRDALFTDQASQRNVTITAANEILNWQNPSYGDTLNDDNLEKVMQSVRWSNHPGTVNVDLGSLTIGSFYKLQLLFHDTPNRGFDILAEGNLIYNDFSASLVAGAGQGAVVTYVFAAADPILNVVLDGRATPFTDKNPVLQGVTLELLPADFTVDTGGPNPNEVTIPAGSTSATVRVTTVNDGVDESAGSEVQRISLSGGSDTDTYKLIFGGQTTATIARNAPAATVQSALEALTSVGPGNVAVTSVDGGYMVTYQGVFVGKDVPQPLPVTVSGGLRVTVTTMKNLNEVVRATIVDRPGYRTSNRADPGFSAGFELFDNNNAGFSVFDSSGSRAEIRIASLDERPFVGAARHTLQLKTKPIANVTVFVASSNTSECLVQLDPAKPASEVVQLAFTPDNWNVPQVFYLQGVDDALDDGQRLCQFVVSAAGEDVAYRELAPAFYDASTSDDDTAGITVTSPQATIDGRVNVFSVVLKTQPSGEVRVTLTPQNDQIEVNGARAGDPATLAFTRDNWNIPQLVRVTAVDDGVVEYFHKSQLNFSVEVGRRLDGPTVADIGAVARAFDLGDISGGVRWTNLPLPARGDTPFEASGTWYRFRVPERSPDQRIRLLTAGDNTRDVPNIFELYKTGGPPFALVKRGVLTPVAVDARGFTVQPASGSMSLDVPAGEYLLRLAVTNVGSDGGPNSPRFDLLIDDSDRVYESVAVTPVPVSIKDNDQPTAEILAGPTASEIFSQPSYFAVRLNAPAPAGPADTGVKVNFRISGGRATQGTASSTLHDYTVVADSFDPATGAGWVRVAPGDVQANLSIVPVDDKLVEDLPVTLSSYSAAQRQVRVSAKPSVADPVLPLDATFAITQGTVITANLPDGREVRFTVRSSTNLVLDGGQTEYAANVPVDVVSPEAAEAAAGLGGTTYRGRLESEDVQVTLLSGDGYLLPLAPNKQDAERSQPANLDPARTVANLTIYDDDVPGIRLVEVDEHTTVAEGTEAAFQFSLTAEPTAPVTVKLTPGSGFAFVAPVNSGTDSLNVVQYTLGTAGIPTDLDLVFVSLDETDQGFAAVFEARLTRVTYGVAARTSTLTLTGAGGGTDSATFQIPGATDTDFAGNPETGNWNIVQRLVVTQLIKNSNGSLTLTLNLNGASSTVTLTPAAAPKSVTTTQFTFQPADWFKLQTVTIVALNNATAEPGEWHRDWIRYTVTSADTLWDKLAVAPQEIHLVDAVLDTGDTIDGLEGAVYMLEDSLSGLQVPLLGTLGEIPGVLSGPLGEALGPLRTALAGQRTVTAGKFGEIAESALKPLVTRGIIGRVQVGAAANEDQVQAILRLQKDVYLGDFSLATDLGLPALGLGFTTTGKVRVDFKLSFDVALGVHRDFGFFIDTAFTGIHGAFRVSLEGTGATPENPANLFTGQGSLFFLQTDFQDDPLNPTELAFTFDVRLNDLDNINTLKFFDIDGDGVLAESPYPFKVGTDANKDGRIDQDLTTGDPVRRDLVVIEPWVNVGASGTVDKFPTVSQLASDPILSDAVRANWNTVGAKTNTFDEAEAVQREGVYRTLTNGTTTLVYLDANRDGELDLGKRNTSAFGIPWTYLTAKEKEASEVWFQPANPKLVKELKILTTGTGTATKYFLDVNQNNRADGGEEISDRLRKKLDKDNSKTLEADVVQDGEGQFVQGSGVAYWDFDGDQKLDNAELFAAYGFDDFHLGTDVFASLDSGAMFLDLNGNGLFDTDEYRVRAVAGTDTIYFDFNNNSVLDGPAELPTKKSSPAFLVPQTTYTPLPDGAGFGGTLGDVEFGGSGVRQIVRTLGGVRFIDLDGNGQLTVDRQGKVLEPVARQSSQLSFDDLAPLVKEMNSGQFASLCLFSCEPGTPVRAAITKLLIGTPLSAVDKVVITQRFHELATRGDIVLQPNDGERLTLAELRAFTQSIRANHATVSDQVKAAVAQLFSYNFRGYANLGLKVKQSVAGSELLPALSFDLAVNLPLFNGGNAKDANNNGFTVELRKVAVDLGSFLERFVGPILDTVNDIIAPIKPIITVLNADTKVFGALGMAGSFESDGRPGISLLEIAKRFTVSSEQAAKIERAIKFADYVTKLVNTIDFMHQSLGETGVLQFGDFTLNNLRAASHDPANVPSRAKNAPRTDGAPATRAAVPSTTSGDIEQQAKSTAAAGLRNKFNALRQLDGLTFNLFEPSTVLALLTGTPNTNLVTYDIPDIDFALPVRIPFKIWGPLAGLIEGGFSFSTDLSAGYDTAGIEQWAKADFAPDKSYLVFDGFFFDDWVPGTGGDGLPGANKDEMTFSSFVSAGLGLDIGIASGFVKGGIEGTIGFDLIDVGERSGTSDGKIRGSDIIEKLSTNPADLFSLDGRINVFLGAEVNVNFVFFKKKVYDKRLATFELAKFKLDVSGLSGSALSGKVQKGPIAGGTVWFDANNNHLLDDGEPSTLTDFEGNYYLVIPDAMDTSAGVIRIHGGMDASTGLPATGDIAIPIGGHGNATAFTALEEAFGELQIDTSAADFNSDQAVDEDDRELFVSLYQAEPANPALDLNRDGTVDAGDLDEFDRLLIIAQHGGTLTVAQAEALIKDAFGIDPSIDLATFAHFDEARAGNPLAGPVLVGENELDEIVTQVEAVLAGAAGVAMDDPRYSDYFSEAAFVAIAHQLAQGGLDLSDRAELLSIVVDAAVLADQWIADSGADVRINYGLLNASIADIVEVMHATVVNDEALVAVATDVVDLARLIVQAKVLAEGKVTRDLYGLAGGTLSGADVVAADAITGPDALAAIEHVPLPPLISAIHDVFVFEDEPLAPIPFRAVRQSPGAGTVSFTITSDKPDLLPASSFSVTEGSNPGDFLLEIQPLAFHQGIAHVTLHATDSAGSSIDEHFTVTVMFVDHPPRAVPDSALVVAGTTVTIHPLANDLDPDQDPLYLDGLTSVPSRGSVVFNADHSLSYTPDPSESGVQTIVYELDDGNGGSATADITIQVLAPAVVDHAAVRLQADQAAENSGTWANVPNVSVAFSASHGEVTDNGDGTWSWRLGGSPVPAPWQTVTITATYNDRVEDRVTFLTYTWHNFVLGPDVDGNGSISPLDVLLLTNYLNAHPGTSQLPAEPATPLRWYDVDGQDDITPQDVLLVINHINRLTAFAGEGEAGRAAADAAHAEFVALPSDAPWHPADLGLFPLGRPHTPAAPELYRDSARATAARRPSSGSLRTDDPGQRGTQALTPLVKATRDWESAVRDAPVAVLDDVWTSFGNDLAGL